MKLKSRNRYSINLTLFMLYLIIFLSGLNSYAIKNDFNKKKHFDLCSIYFGQISNDSIWDLYELTLPGNTVCLVKYKLKTISLTDLKYDTSYIVIPQGVELCKNIYKQIPGCYLNLKKIESTNNKCDSRKNEPVYFAFNIWQFDAKFNFKTNTNRFDSFEFYLCKHSSSLTRKERKLVVYLENLMAQLACLKE